MNSNRALVAIDAHVHLHERLDPIHTLRLAHRALRQAAPEAQNYMVMLACRDRHRPFISLRIRLAHTREPESLRYDEDGSSLIVVAGRQIVTAERIEILALGSLTRIEDGIDAERTIAVLREQDAVVVLPWGVGKWLGARGKLIDRLLHEYPDVRTGDIGGRPRFWPVPQFKERRPSLSGSDNLPLPGSDGQVGNFGSVVEAGISRERPLADLKQALANGAESWALGRHRNVAACLNDQIRLLLTRRVS